MVPNIGDLAKASRPARAAAFVNVPYRTPDYIDGYLERVPRMRGDDPEVVTDLKEPLESSPHARG